MPRTKKSSTLNTLARQEKKLILQIRNWIILIVVVLLIGLGIYALSHLGSVTEISSVVLPLCATASRIFLSSSFSANPV